jgi:hypothetical protein
VFHVHTNKRKAASGTDKQILKEKERLRKYIPHKTAWAKRESEDDGIRVEKEW